MRTIKFSFLLTLSFLLGSYTNSADLNAGEHIKLRYLSHYPSGELKGSAEIVSFDHASQLAFVTNGLARSIDAISLAKPELPFLEFRINIKPFGFPNSVAVKNDLVAVAVANNNPQANGWIVIFNTKGEYLNKFSAGPMPDMVTFSPNAKYVLSANEGEPNDAYDIDPEGSITIVDLVDDVRKLTQKNVRTADFKVFTRASLDPWVRIIDNNASVAQDLEPEHISISADSKTAWVSLQENNALAQVSLEFGRVKKIIGLGTLSHNTKSTAIDASDKDNGINIKAWPVEGLFQPDSIATFNVANDVYIVTANEGDARNYSGFSEVVRVKDLALDGALFSNIQNTDQLGRLKVSTIEADPDGNGLADKLVSFGTRSFSIWNADGYRVYDSGSEFARITARDHPDLFNANDTRSDDKGSEPEALAIGRVGNSLYAFIGLERTGGIMVYNITQPEEAFFVDYINNFSPRLSPEASYTGDRGPESIVFVSAKNSPNGTPFIITGNEISGTVSVYQILDRASP